MNRISLAGYHRVPQWVASEIGQDSRSICKRLIYTTRFYMYDVVYVFVFQRQQPLVLRSSW